MQCFYDEFLWLDQLMFVFGMAIFCIVILESGFLVQPIASFNLVFNFKCDPRLVIAFDANISQWYVCIDKTISG